MLALDIDIFWGCILSLVFKTDKLFELLAFPTQPELPNKWINFQQSYKTKFIRVFGQIMKNG
jgi:hypothetical protein